MKHKLHITMRYLCDIALYVLYHTESYYICLMKKQPFEGGCKEPCGALVLFIERICASGIHLRRSTAACYVCVCAGGLQ